MDIYSVIPSSCFSLLEENNKIIFILDYFYLNQLRFYDLCKLSLQEIIYCCGLKLDKHKGGTNDKFKQLLYFLRDNDLITFDDEINKVNDIIHINLNYPGSNNFFMLYEKDKHKILNYAANNKLDKFSLLNVYCYLLSCIGSNNKYCFPSYDDISNKTSINRRSINKYISALDEIDLIKYKNIGLITNKDGENFKANNVYVLYGDNWQDNINVGLNKTKEFYLNIGCKI